MTGQYEHVGNKTNRIPWSMQKESEGERRRIHPIHSSVLQVDSCWFRPKTHRCVGSRLGQVLSTRSSRLKRSVWRFLLRTWVWLLDVHLHEWTGQNWGKERNSNAVQTKQTRQTPFLLTWENILHSYYGGLAVVVCFFFFKLAFIFFHEFLCTTKSLSQQNVVIWNTSEHFIETSRRWYFPFGVANRPIVFVCVEAHAWACGCAYSRPTFACEHVLLKPKWQR